MLSRLPSKRKQKRGMEKSGSSRRFQSFRTILSGWKGRSSSRSTIKEEPTEMSPRPKAGLPYQDSMKLAEATAKREASVSHWHNRYASRRENPMKQLLEASQDLHELSQEFAIEEEKIEEEEPQVTYNDAKFKSLYTLEDELGEGAFAVVYSGTHRQTKKEYAIKVCKGNQMSDEDVKAMHFEISIGMELEHPNIVRLYEAFFEKNNYYLVTEKMMGGELLDRIVQKEFYNEKEARDTCLVLFQAIEYCHSKRIAHRDLKPENLLLEDDSNDCSLKLADFGFSKRCPEGGYRTMCGSPSYVAPEILSRAGGYDWQCDMWSLGVIVYILLGGYSPFDEDDHNVLVQRITSADYVFDEQYWDPISDDAKDLIRSLLTLDPKKRLTASQALEHKWMTVSDEVLANQDLGANLTSLQKFTARRKLKAAVKIIIATRRLTLH